MAEPLILAYGRGELPEFPASPDSVVDIVPCDHVVNAILAVCATEPEIGRPEYYHVSSGARNPLTFHEIYGHIRDYFTEHPFEGGAAGRPGCRSGSSRARRRSSGCCPPPSGRTGWPNGLLAQAPRSDRTRKIAKDLDRTRSRLDFLRRYHSLYNEYAQSELHFVDDNTLRADHRAAPGRPGRVRVRHRGLRLEDLHRGRALPGDHRAGPPDGRAPAQARQPADHDEGPEPRTPPGSTRAGHLRPGRHDHVHQRDRAVPVGPAARALPRRPARRDRPGASAGCRPTSAPSSATAAPSCARSTGATGAPTWPSWSEFVDTTHGAAHPEPAVAGRRPPDPRAPGRRAHHDPDHRRGPAADPAAASRCST